MQEISKVITLYDDLKATATPSALAVVVTVEQSSYRRVGARLLVAADGRFVGGISGGCLEGDALRRARTAIFREQPSLHVYDTLDGEDKVIGIGLGCNGRIGVLFLPLDYGDVNNEVELLKGMATTRVPRLLVRQLPTPAIPYPPARVHTREQLSELAEACDLSPSMLQEKAADRLTDGRSKVLHFPNKEGLETRLLFETLQPRLHLILTGTNYDIPAALTAARALGWRTTVVGARRKFTTAIAALADQLVDYGEVDTLTVDEATAVVLMSHDYNWDGRMVRHFLPLLPPYLGMLGPRKRTLSMAEDLELPELLEYPHLYSPVGLDIGAETPEEIAASLVAEIVMVFRGRSGGALRARSGTIH